MEPRYDPRNKLNDLNNVKWVHELFYAREAHHASEVS